MKKTTITTLSSTPLCAESFTADGYKGVLHASRRTAEIIAAMVEQFAPNLTVEFVNQVDEVTPVNQDKSKFYLRVSRKE